MQQKLVFFFGRDPALSLAEACFFFSDRGIAFSIAQKSEKFAVFGFEKPVDARQTIAAFGGTTKIAEVLFETEKLDEKSLEKKFFETAFFDGFPGKFFFHCKALTSSPEDDAVLRSVLVQGFKKQRAKAMFKHPKPFEDRAQETMGPSELRRWKLISEGFELVVLKVGESFLVCRTVVAADVEALKKRDLQRPAQKPKQEISLRLARIMLNLAGAAKGKTLLDIFCGTGTILQEALFNGANAIGIELDASTAAMAERNLEWFSQNQKPLGVWRVITADSAKISRVLKKGEFDCVATEPYMGPLINNVLPEQIVKKRIVELEQLYSLVFAELAKLTERGKRIVFILPSIPATNGKKIAAGERVFTEHGFAVKNPAGLKVFPYNYQQEGSKILRRIYVLEKA